MRQAKRVEPKNTQLCQTGQLHWASSGTRRHARTAVGIVRSSMPSQRTDGGKRQRRSGYLLYWLLFEARRAWPFAGT